MIKPLFDHYSWACGYSIYHPVFYSCIKTNTTPAHVNSWPIKRIYVRKGLETNSKEIKYYKYREEGDRLAFEQSKKYPDITPGDKSKRILLKRFSARCDINEVSKLLSLSDVPEDEYYLIARCIMREGSIPELMAAIEKGLKSGKAPPVTLLGDIMEKAILERNYKSCDRIWEILSLTERDFKVVKCVLLKLTLINDDKQLLAVYRKALEWNVLSKKVKKAMLECAKRFSSLHLQDWAFRLRLTEEKHENRWT